jgi:hypothetical protein
MSRTLEFPYKYQDDAKSTGLAGKEVVEIMSKFDFRTVVNFENKFRRDPGHTRDDPKILLVEVGTPATFTDRYHEIGALQKLPPKPFVIMVTSCIHTQATPLSYNMYRSSFSHRERLEQTIEGVKSLRDYFAGSAYIFLLESSRLFQHEIDALLKHVDRILVLSDAQDTAIQHSNNKSNVEGLSCYYFTERLQAVGQQFDYLCKLSGRYKLSPSFNIFRFIYKPAADLTPRIPVLQPEDKPLFPTDAETKALDLLSEDLSLEKEDRIVFRGNGEGATTLWYTVPYGLLDYIVKQFKMCTHPTLNIETTILRGRLPIHRFIRALHCEGYLSVQGEYTVL